MADKTVQLNSSAKNPNNVEAKKYYIFNETGNIMMASTVDSGNPITKEVQDVFAEVSVFFAGMSRAITTTINPDTGKPYSLYNYTALERIISGSGLFVHVTETDLSYESHQWGANFSKELLEALLGLATGAGALSFATAMISSIGQEGLNISGSSSRSDSKVGNIVFVCEYLLGMPSISAIVVYADANTHKQQLDIGPCFKESSVTTNWEMHKDTYLFVTPTFIRQYAGDLDSINMNPEYMELISWFSGLLLQTPSVKSVVDSTKPNENLPSGSALAKGTTYSLLGQFLGSEKGSLKFSESGSKGKINVGSWGTNEVQFTVEGTQATASSIQVLDKSGKVLTNTSQTFTIA
ncbi:MAG: hypothetical protein JJU34_00975 [Lunatimonas sp.]|uniref:hypothetical protein n=1 Tax=Lunatimonas sp. TaxID=2060141 RepID=UPI00263B70E4|nr:hypothetical protein [Lunatimonas sp.]MCC5935828.1 hypothetical protein [Lunatimonas sp.]